MAEVFISYKSERRPAARFLAKCLRLHGFDAWYDYGLLPGEDFDARLMAELSTANVCVALWCSLSTKSQWVRREVDFAAPLGRLVPCWIERCELPEAYRHLDTIDLSLWDGAPRSHVLDRLIGEVGRRLDRAPKPDFAGLRELDEDWRALGSPSLSKFALSEPTPALHEPNGASHDETRKQSESVTERDLVGTHWMIYPPNVDLRRELWLLAGGNAQYKYRGVFEPKHSANWSMRGDRVKVYKDGFVYDMEYDQGRMFGECRIDYPHQIFAVHAERLDT